MRLPLLLLSAILLLPAAVLADTQLPAREIRILGTEPLDRLEIAAFTDEIVPVKKWRGEADLVLSGGEVVPLTGVARQKRSGLSYKLKTAKRAAVRAKVRLRLDSAGEVVVKIKVRLKREGVKTRLKDPALAFVVEGAPPPNPDIALITVSGHNALLIFPSEPYLKGTIGKALERELEREGFTVTSFHYVDAREDNSEGRGWLSLVEDLIWVRDNWVLGQVQPTRVIIVNHSHGGVRSHAAIREVPDLPVTMLVDLDANSCEWDLVHAEGEVPIGPADAFRIGGDDFDLEDVVFDNVEFDLDVRSGDLCPPFFQGLFEDAWNLRLDGSDTGVTKLDAGTNHSEVHDPDGTTVPQVIAWVMDRLAGP